MTREEAEGLLAIAREAKLLGPDAKSWIDRLAPKRQEFVEAVRFLAQNGDEEAAAELGANVWRLWLVLGDIASGRQMLSAALDVGQGKPSRVRSLALYGDGALAFRAGAQQDSQVRNEEALAAARTVGDREAEALALVGLSRVALRNGDYGRVQSLAATARALTRDLDPAAEVAPLHLLAAGTRLAGEYNQAIDLYVQSLELNRRLGDSRMVGMELHNIGHVEIHRGRVQEAERSFKECAAIRNQDDPYEAAMARLNEAALAFARGEHERAAELLRHTQSTLDGAGIVLDPDDAFEVKWLRERVGSSVH
jgi:tetratricopeptide (TPR) repeat protein